MNTDYTDEKQNTFCHPCFIRVNPWLRRVE